jgi:hypothetical protein
VRVDTIVLWRMGVRDAIESSLERCGEKSKVFQILGMMIDCQGNVESKAHKMTRTLASYGKGAKLNGNVESKAHKTTRTLASYGKGAERNGNVESKAHKTTRTLASYGKGAKLNCEYS